ncbi:MAG: hypothetical protein A2029_02310 [Chloroflexi bacterium RBG_19FT_COMBO_47_9]|nr:MAG: hypothetical protein A2029_02310 [Chloroflexi bacterium RBG_19FT_COMBO_47_9]
MIENKERRGLSGARNSGVALSTGEVVAFIDEDAAADNAWVENLLSSYQYPQVIGVGGEVRPEWTVPPPGWFPEEFHWVVGCSYKGLPEVKAPVRNPIGCNMSFRRQALISAGGFRNGVGRIGTLPVGCEETELTIRLRQQNPNSVYLYQPRAVVMHKVPEWRLKWRYFIQRCYSEGISKALVTHYVGSTDGLSSERRYVIYTLPKGIFSGLLEAITRRRLSGFKRAAAIIVGLMITTTGYLAGMFKRLRSKYLSAWVRQKATSHARES